MSLEEQEIVVDFAEEAECAQVSTLLTTTHIIKTIQEKLVRKGFLTCEECGDHIPEDRRVAYPAARTCVPCQTWIEKFYRT
jgi:phage/conjugal plasmid C-4 type zinc finger TraR family protein